MTDDELTKAIQAKRAQAVEEGWEWIPLDITHDNGLTVLSAVVRDLYKLGYDVRVYPRIGDAEMPHDVGLTRVPARAKRNFQ